MPTRQDYYLTRVLLMLSWQDGGFDLRVYMMTWQYNGAHFSYNHKL